MSNDPPATRGQTTRRRPLRWLDDIAGQIERRAEPGGPEIVCASGLSPTRRIHAGNLREVFISHLVAEELDRRGLPAVHLLSWDDYDPMRRVAGSLPSHLAPYLERPVARIPDPRGGPGSFADYAIEEVTPAFAQLGIRPREVHQSRLHAQGRYNAGIRTALEHRRYIFDVLESRRAPDPLAPPVDVRRDGYYPFRPYCDSCLTDRTVVVGYERAEVSYRCACGFAGALSVAGERPVFGKLTWKVDWALRWAVLGIAFEPGNANQHAPAGAFGVAVEFADKLFGIAPPCGLSYNSVFAQDGGDACALPTPAELLGRFEPALLRWIYARRAPQQTVVIDLGPSAVREIYQEWHRFTDRAAARPSDSELLSLCTTPGGRGVATPRIPIPFPVLTAIADGSLGDRGRIVRAVAEHTDPEGAAPTEDDLEPRLSCAISWWRSLPREQRCSVRSEPDTAYWHSLDERLRTAIESVVDRAPQAWSAAGLRDLLHASVPVLPDADETGRRAAQRTFFVCFYRLLCGTDAGPRLPALLLSIGLPTSTYLLLPER